MIQTHNTDKKHVLQLVEICRAQGIRQVVISPGSRSTPLVIAFNRMSGMKCHLIIDERAAAFYALGIAQCLQEPVALVCTSGTALLNYSPAVAEAYYQQVPLLVISADRPSTWIDQDDSQTIRQVGALEAVTKGGYQLVEYQEEQELHWYNNRIIHEAIFLMKDDRKGPVHVNVPLSEPLYGLAPYTFASERHMVQYPPAGGLSPQGLVRLQEQLSAKRKVLIFCSLHQPDEVLQAQLEQWASLPQVVVLAESVSNLQHPTFVNQVDRVLSKMSGEELDALAPEVVLSLGGPIISKVFKQWLRSRPPQLHGWISPGSRPVDTFQCLTEHIALYAGDFFAQFPLPVRQEQGENSYAQQWQDLSVRAAHLHEQYLSQAPWSDLKAFEALSKALPSPSQVHLSNGTAVRYHQLFDRDQRLTSYANRGTSGIDGSTSTAAGNAVLYDGVTTCITGDISFLYDSNALWNSKLSPNLKIIVLNNQGGGIFRFIAGPSTLDEFETFFETHVPVDIKSLCQAYGLGYFQAHTSETLEQALLDLYASTTASILEVVTPKEINDKILRNYFQFKT